MNQLMRPDEGAVELSQVGGEDVDRQVATAKRYPRDMQAFVAEVSTLATLDDDTAAGCMYFVPRAGGFIEGYSVRFAELCASAYGNLRVAMRNVSRQTGKDASATAEAVCWDLERNVVYRSEVTRRVYRGDYELAEANAQSTAGRNAVLKTVPQGLLRAVKLKVREQVLGSAEDMRELLDRLVQWLRDDHRVSEQDIGKFLGGGKGALPRKQWTADHVFVLRTVCQNIRDGSRSAAETFGVAGKAPQRGAAQPAPMDGRQAQVAAEPTLAEQVMAYQNQKGQQWRAILDEQGLPMDLADATKVQLEDALRALKR